MANISLTFPIFSGFKNYAKYKQAKVDLSKAHTEYRKTRASIMIEVDESVMNLKKAIEQIESRRMNVREAEKAVELAERSGMSRTSVWRRIREMEDDGLIQGKVVRCVGQCHPQELPHHQKMDSNPARSMAMQP